MIEIFLRFQSYMICFYVRKLSFLEEGGRGLFWNAVSDRYIIHLYIYTYNQTGYIEWWLRIFPSKLCPNLHYNDDARPFRPTYSHPLYYIKQFIHGLRLMLSREISYIFTATIETIIFSPASTSAICHTGKNTIQLTRNTFIKFINMVKYVRWIVSYIMMYLRNES